jgi:hypothetical protein
MFPESYAANVSAGHDLRLNITLVTGITFKMMGLFIC